MNEAKKKIIIKIKDAAVVCRVVYISSYTGTRSTFTTITVCIACTNTIQFLLRNEIHIWQ